VGFLTFIGIAGTVIFYLKIDPQRWAAVAGLGVLTAVVAKVTQSVRGWMGRRRELAASSQGEPSGPQQIAGSQDDSGSAGEEEGDGDVGN
jgi:hypothetical protein